MEDVDPSDDLPWSAVRLLNPEPYDPLVLVSYNAYDGLSKSRLGSGSTWKDSLVWDSSAPCMVSTIVGEGLILHACQTEGISSGAPLVRVDESNGTIDLVGIHIGAARRGERNEEIWSKYGIDTLAVPNLGNVMENSFRETLQQ